MENQCTQTIIKSQNLGYIANWLSLPVLMDAPAFFKTTLELF